MSSYRGAPEVDPGYSVQGHSRRCVLPKPGPKFGFFSVDAIESNNPNTATHPILADAPTQVDFRILDSGIHSNRFYVDTGGTLAQDLDYAAGKPWTPTPFVKTVPGVERFVLIYPVGG